MRVKNKNDGFTLLELMITILIGSIITLATTTILLLGLRLNNESNATVKKQNTTRILLATLEDLATEGMIKEIIIIPGAESDDDSWQIIGHNEDKVIFEYDAEHDIIYTGSKEEEVPLLEKVENSTVSLSDKKVLMFSLEVEDGVYSSSMYCRTVPSVSNEEKIKIFEDIKKDQIVIDDDGSKTSIARKEFLKILASQYGSNGVIITDSSSETLTYYSQWYIGSHNWGDGESAETWNAQTPWCACFLSWALAQMKPEHIDVEMIPHESHVNNYFQYFSKSESDPYIWKTSNPIPGDIIFFDWDKGSGNGYDHVGVVLKVDETTTPHTIYTIEGNTTNKVAVRNYQANDTVIVGYGVLDWKENPQT